MSVSNKIRPSKGQGRRAPKTEQIKRTMDTVMEATMELLSEIGYRSLTIGLISERSGVARSTIYRHWNNIPELTIQAFDSAIGPNLEFKEKGDIRKDLLTLYRGIGKSLSRSVWGRALPALIEASHNDPKFHGLINKLADERRQAARDMLNRAKARGELKPQANIEWMLDSISGPLYHRLLITGKSMVETGFIATLVETVLAANLAD